MPTNTTNYNLAKPLVNDPTDQDLWGGELNGNMDIIDTTMKANADAIAAIASLPSGMIMQYAASTPPAGWLECNGSAVSRTTYSVLFGIISTTFGIGDGTTTFNLPDTRGYFVRGWDHGAGVDTGRTFGSTQLDAFQQWTASFITREADSTQVTTGIATHANSGISGASNSSTGSTITLDPSITARTSTETRPKNLSLMYCIKT